MKILSSAKPSTLALAQISHKPSTVRTTRTGYCLHHRKQRADCSLFSSLRCAHTHTHTTTTTEAPPRPRPRPRRRTLHPFDILKMRSHQSVLVVARHARASKKIAWQSVNFKQPMEQNRSARARCCSFGTLLAGSSTRSFHSLDLTRLNCGMHVLYTVGHWS